MKIRTSLPVLSDPGGIDSTALQTQIVMTPLTSMLADSHGRTDTQTSAFLKRRVVGGVGLIIVNGITAMTRSAAVEALLRFLLWLEVEILMHVFRNNADALHIHCNQFFAEIIHGFRYMEFARVGHPFISASSINVVRPKKSFLQGVSDSCDAFHKEGGKYVYKSCWCCRMSKSIASERRYCFSMRFWILYENKYKQGIYDEFSD